MLVLSRLVNQRILIGDNVVLTVIRARDGKARLGFEAPDDVKIIREELLTVPLPKKSNPCEREDGAPA